MNIIITIVLGVGNKKGSDQEDEEGVAFSNDEEREEWEEEQKVSKWVWLN